MAFKKMRKARRMFGKVKRYSRSNSESSPIEGALFSAGYGVIRKPVADMVPDVQALGAYSDNVILGGIGYLGARYGSGMIRKAGKTILNNEAFIAGAKASQGMLGNSGASNGSVYD